MVAANKRSNIELKSVTIDLIHENTWNPNKQTQRVYAAEKESITEYGFIDPITVRPHPELDDEFEVIDGAHRLRACKELGFTEVEVNVLTGLSDAEVKKLTVVLNETKGEADKIELAKLLADIQEDLGSNLILGLPYEENELGELIALADVDWQQFDGANFDDVPDDNEDIDAEPIEQTEHTCPNCGHQF